MSHSFKPKPHPFEALARSVFGLNERISLEGFWRLKLAARVFSITLLASAVAKLCRTSYFKEHETIT